MSLWAHPFIPIVAIPVVGSSEQELYTHLTCVTRIGSLSSGRLIQFTVRSSEAGMPVFCLELSAFEVSFLLFQHNMLLQLDAFTTLSHPCQPEHELTAPCRLFSL